MEFDDKSEYGLLTIMGGKLDEDLKAVNQRLALIEEKLELLLSLVDKRFPVKNTFDYVVEMQTPYYDTCPPTLTGTCPTTTLDEDEGTE